MPFQRVPDTAEIIIHETIGGQNCVNTFYAKKDGGYTADDLAVLAAAVDVWWATEILPIQSTQVTYDRTDVRGLDAAIDYEASSSTSAGAGGLGSPALPNNAALAIKRRSANTGRGARGRVFIGGLPQSGMDTLNIVDDVVATTLADGLNMLRDVVDAISWTEVIVHRVAAGVPLPEAVLFTVVEYVVVDKVIDSMRRRLPGRGT